MSVNSENRFCGAEKVANCLEAYDEVSGAGRMLLGLVRGESIGGQLYHAFKRHRNAVAVVYRCNSSVDSLGLCVLPSNTAGLGKELKCPAPRKDCTYQ